MTDPDITIKALKKMQRHPGLDLDEGCLIKCTIKVIERLEGDGLLLDEWIDGILRAEDMLAICRRVRQRLNGGNVVVFKPVAKAETSVPTGQVDSTMLDGKTEGSVLMRQSAVG